MNEISPEYHNQYDTKHSKFNKFFPAHNKSYYRQRNSVEVKSIPEQITKKKQDKNNYTVSFLFAAGIGLLFLTKGFQKNTHKSLLNIKDNLEARLDRALFNADEKKSMLYKHFIRRLNSFIHKAESVNNINSLKDILFMKLMKKTKPTETIHSAISNLFERLSVNTIKSAYKKTQKKFNKMYKVFDHLDDYILKNSPDDIVEYKGKQYNVRELVEMAKNYRDSVKLVVNAFISDKTQKERYDYIKNSTSKLYSSFWDNTFSGFWTKNNKFKRKEMWQTFIAAEQLKNNKTYLAELVAYTRNMLSYTDADRVTYLSGYLKNLDSLILNEDEKSLDIIRRLKWFIRDPYTIKEHKHNILKELDKLEKTPMLLTDDEKRNQSMLADKASNISLLRAIISDKATGELQDMLDIYYTIAPCEFVKSGANRATKIAVKAFDKSIRLENEEFFDKARDLELGSAPTDVLTVLTSGSLITYGLVKAKNNDEKYSVILKSGIPIIGAVTTSLISATKLISGTKSVLLGLISGIILNQIGNIADKYRKANYKKIVNN